MPSTCQRLGVDQLLERTWVSSNDQAPANASANLQPNHNRAPRAQRAGAFLGVGWQVQRSLDRTAQVRATTATPSWTMRSPLRDWAGQRIHRPLESDPLTIAYGQPSGVHCVECGFEWARLAALPG